MSDELISVLQNFLEDSARTGGLLKDIETRGRVVSLEDSPGGIRVRIASDGLTLEQKILIERLLLRHCADQEISIVGVNFARITSATAGQTAPTTVKRSMNAFGIQQDKKAIPGVRHVVVVASGKGGVGKSTVSANLAVALAVQGLRVGLMDCDVYGPSAPILLGIRGQIQVAPGGKLLPMLGHGVKTISFGFLSDAKSPVIWRGPLVSKAVEQLCYDVDWGDIDVMIVDMPPGTGDVQLTIAERLPLHAAIVVTTPQDVALIDAHKAVSMFERLDVPIAGVVENMAWYECGNCGHTEHIFGTKSFSEFLRSRQLVLLSRIPLLGDIRIGSDRGQPLALLPQSAAGSAFHDLATKTRTYLNLV